MLKYTHTYKFNSFWFRFNHLCFQEYMLWFYEYSSSKKVYIVYTYIRFHSYTSMPYMFIKTYFDVSSSLFQVLFLSIVWDLLSKIKLYHLYVYWIISIHTKLQMCFNILFLYLNKFWKNEFFILKFIYEKYGFWFKT